MNYTKNTCCRICGNPNLYKFLELGPQPPANAFLSSKEDFDTEQFFPLDVYFCPDCGLVQLTDIINPDILFRDYAYFTGKSSKTMQIHFQKLAEKLIEEYKLKPNDLVIDIGSGDGTLLKNFNCRVIGVDPAVNVARQANLNGVKTLCDYFTANSAWKILNQAGKAKVIIGTNVFAHANNLYDFMAGVNLLLRRDGVFVIEVPHLMEQFKMGSFDQCYHEHLSYFLTSPISILALKFGMVLSRVEKIPVHGGSIRCYMTKPWAVVQHNMPKVYQEEMKSELYIRKTYQTFADKVRKTKEDLVTLLVKLKDEGNRIIGYGAPAKGNTLLNYCQIGPDILDYLTDTTPYKQGKYSPGMHIPVVSPRRWYDDCDSPYNCPDYALMFPWNYKEEILKKESKFIEQGGKFIIPIPEPKIVS